LNNKDNILGNNYNCKTRDCRQWKKNCE